MLLSLLLRSAGPRRAAHCAGAGHGHLSWGATADAASRSSQHAGAPPLPPHQLHGQVSCCCTLFPSPRFTLCVHMQHMSQSCFASEYVALCHASCSRHIMGRCIHHLWRAVHAWSAFCSASSLLHLNDRSVLDLQYINAPACNLNWHVNAGLRRW